MNRLAHSIIICLGLTILVTASGCDKLPTGPEIANALSPPPAERWYDGAVFYTGSVALEVRVKLDSTDPEHRDYNNWRLLDATSSGNFSSRSYYFHARGYVLEFRNANTKLMVRTVTVTPDNIHDERVYEYLSMMDWVYDYNRNRTDR